MIKYIKGDLFNYLNKTPTVKMVAHCVNSHRLMGSGFALAAYTKWPKVKECYEANPDISLGSVEFIHCQATPCPVIVANMVGQEGIVSARNPKPIKYTALVHCMEKVRHFIKNPKGGISPPYPIEIHAPKFGSDRARGSWPLIEELINEIWADIPVYIYYL